MRATERAAVEEPIKSLYDRVPIMTVGWRQMAKRHQPIDFLVAHLDGQAVQSVALTLSR